MKITKVIGREIFDSRGLPTVECQVDLEEGLSVYASVPAGLSRGPYEAYDLRDGGSRLMGQGVLKAIEKLETIIAPSLIGLEPDVIATDMLILELDGTDNLSKLGANAALAASIAVCRAQALIEGLEVYELIAHICDVESVALPFAMFNVINGGVHAHNGLPIQEFMILPAGAQNFRESMECAAIIFHTLGNVLQKRGKLVAVGDEGGYACSFKDEQEALDLLMEAVEITKIDDVVLALDVAASQFYDAQKKTYQWGNKELSSEEMVVFYTKLVESYPIYSLEDGMASDDTVGWQMLMKELDEDVQIVGDDLFATNTARIADGIEQGLANAVIIKPNQVGTVTQTLQAIKLCKEYDLNSIVSHRSGETNDTFIVDLAVGTCAGQIKAGGPCRGERMAKYNMMLRIEDTLMHSMLGG